MYAYMLWSDTTAGIMKMRNGANSAWISLWELDGTFIATDISLSAGTAGAPSLYFTGDPDSGLFSPGADQVAISTNGTGRLFVNSAGNVGIGTASPSATLHVAPSSGSANFQISRGSKGLQINQDSDSADPSINTIGATALKFLRDGSESMRIDTSGRLLVGVSSTSLSTTMVVQGRPGDPNGPGAIFLQGNYAGPADSLYAELAFNNVSYGGALAKIQAYGATRTSGSPGYLVFSTCPDGSASPTERMRITDSGRILINGAASGGVCSYGLQMTGSASDDNHIRINNENSSFNNGTLVIGIVDASTGTSFDYFGGWKGGDRDFGLSGDGTGRCDGSWTGGGADYAEYFEWSDSNPDEEDRRGISVVLDGEKIREAVAGEDPIGVISGNPSVVGDAAWNKWNGKFLRDDYGSYIYDEQDAVCDDGSTINKQVKILNPAYDPNVEYIPREQRPEWDCVGLMGKLRIRKGQVTGSRWIKMRDISDSVEEWLVR